MRPVDRNEVMARVKTQLRKKRYADKLRNNMQLGWRRGITDQLTGLHNRRYMARHLDTLMKNASDAKPISFLIMDIDYFKAVNDTYGHDVGDEVLRDFASRIGANVRGIDLACRYRGDEIEVATSYTEFSIGYTIGQRYRQNISPSASSVNIVSHKIYSPAMLRIAT